LAFTLIELLVVVAIIGLLMSILLPTLSLARARGRATKCLSNLRTLGQGLAIYQVDNRDVLVPGRLPKIDDCNAYAVIFGRAKYRPTFSALMSPAVGAPPFSDPKACRNEIDQDGERGDMQNFSYDVYVCPDTPEWTDERDACYGYNYQFLGNSRVFDTTRPDSYKNWPLQITRVRNPGRTVAAADCMGTAASFPRVQREPYEDDSRDAFRFGNEGFNLDPPQIDLAEGEAAGIDDSPPVRSAADARHTERANVVWADGHASAHTLEQLGYELDGDGVITFEGENMLWTGNGLDVPWTPNFRP